jgi:hypothetical protein
LDFIIRVCFELRISCFEFSASAAAPLRNSRTGISIAR